MLEVVVIPVLADNYIYVVHDSDSQLTAAVDPALARPVTELLAARGWALDFVLNTHHHADHVGANLELRQTTGCRIVGAAHDAARIPGLDWGLGEGESLHFGFYDFQVLATPGHTLGHVVYYCAEAGLLFAGDTLFSLGCGRLFEGDAATMLGSLQKLKALSAETQLYCAHEYTLNNARFALSVDGGNEALREHAAWAAERRSQGMSTLPSTLRRELAANPFLRTDDPGLRQALGFGETADEAAVFAQLRRMKDEFH